MQEPGQSIKSSSRWAIAATLVSISMATLLIILKAVAWYITGSAALLGSLADSILDLLGSAIAYAGVKWAAEPADEDHRFGHDKAEAIAGLVQSFIIMVSALFVVVESVQRLIAPEPLVRGELAFGVMVISLILTFGLVAFQSFALRRSGSVAVEGDRAHYVGDLIANAGAIIAIFISMKMGILRADAVAGLIAGVFLAWSAFSIWVKVMPQLMDQELPEKDRSRIVEISLADEDVINVHELRTRMAGQKVHIQLHLELEPTITLLRAHHIAERVEQALIQAYPEADIILHQDPYGEIDAHDE